MRDPLQMPPPGREPVSRIEAALLAFISLAVVAAGLRAILGVESRLAFLLYDDAFYYQGIASHLARGLGSTFDGIHATNGYHPLWCWLLVPIYLVVSDPGVAMRWVAAAWFALAAAVPPAVWWALRPRTGAAGALLAAALFGLHPYLGLHLMRPNGLETPLFALLVALFAGSWERALGPRAPVPDGRRGPSPAALAALGALLGLVILARVDGGFLAVAAAALLGISTWRRGGSRPALTAVAALTLGAVLVAGPSLAWNQIGFGSPVPISGRVVSAWQAPRRAEMGAPLGPEFLRERLGTGTHRLPRRLARYAVEGSPAGDLVWSTGRVGGVLVLVAAAGLAAAALRRRRRRGSLAADAVGLVTLFAGLHYAVYAAWYWTGGEALFRLYYMMPESLAVAAWLGAWLGPRLEALAAGPRRLALPAAVAAVMAAWMLLVSGRHLQQLDSVEGRVGDHFVYGWIKAALPPEAILGAIGSGRLGTFSGRPAVDLDGLVMNPGFLEALRNDRVDAFVAASPITHLVGGQATLLGFDPEQPATPPRVRADLGELLWRLANRHDTGLRVVPGTPGRTVVVELIRPGAESSP